MPLPLPQLKLKFERAQLPLVQDASFPQQLHLRLTFFYQLQLLTIPFQYAIFPPFLFLDLVLAFQLQQLLIHA
jgi:hypothetical protein